ncbi:MAG: hypothetical protein JWP35_2604 [Caulobacter sp.]|nr:hypothetical protein [Caulobacter sp.]
MRRFATLALTILLAGAFTTATVEARQRRGGGDDDKERADAAKKKKRDSEWDQSQAPLQALRNAGPCPYVKVLYDAGRYVDFKEGKEASSNVGFTGEIQGISAGCAYKGDEPIRISMDVLFALGRGPQATESHKTYRYWVAVTDRNREILAKEYFDLPVTFAAGQDRVMVNESLEGITIPRVDQKVSGSNFEVLIGFEVTPEQAAFNRDGKRFRVNAGQATVASGAAKVP